MSMFWCARCDELRDSDDGCEEYGPKGTDLICVDCMDELDDEANQGPTETYDSIYNRLVAGGCPEDLARELAKEKGR